MEGWYALGALRPLLLSKQLQPLIEQLVRYPKVRLLELLEGIFQVE